MNSDHPSRALADFAAQLQFERYSRAGRAPRRGPVSRLVRFGAGRQGRAAGRDRSPASCSRWARPTARREILIHRKRSSPLIAAAVNAAASHFAEQDDVHNGSVFHPAAVVFPAALAVAQALGSSGRELLAASVAGYEVGIRVGEFLGRSHYKVFHTTGTAGTLAAAAAVGRLLKLTPEQMLHAFGSAGTPVGRAVGVPARRRRFEAAAYRACRGCRPDRGLSGRRRLHRRAAYPRRLARHGRRHVERRRSGAADRPARQPLDAGRDLVQVPCRRAAIPIRPPTRCCS